MSLVDILRRYFNVDPLDDLPTDEADLVAKLVEEPPFVGGLPASGQTITVRCGNGHLDTLHELVHGDYFDQALLAEMGERPCPRCGGGVVETTRRNAIFAARAKYGVRTARTEWSYGLDRTALVREVLATYDPTPGV